MKKRYVALDVLRGLTVAFMCIVNNPGTWGKIYPPLRHAAWNGCTPTDLVYPFFVFCMGAAMVFSLSKYEGLTLGAFGKILKRGALIFLVGFLLNLYPFYPTSLHDKSASFWENYSWWIGHKRIMGVLQRIACSYVAASLIVLWLKKSPKKVIFAILTLFVVYTGIQLAFGTEPGPFTLEGSAIRRIDTALIGENHVYKSYRFTQAYAEAKEFADATHVLGHGEGISRTAPFDPEGLMGTMTGACTALLGFLVGFVIKGSRKRFELTGAADDAPAGLVARLFAGGAALVGAGLLLGIWVPINKPLWSASYVLYAGGWATLALALLSWCIDVKGWEKWFTPAKAMGMNALAAFVLSGLLSKTFSWIGWNPARYFTANEFVSFVYAILFMLVIFAVMWVLYKKKIVIKL